MSLHIHLTLETAVRITLADDTKEFIVAEVLNLTKAVDRLTASVDRIAAGSLPGDGVPQADVDTEAARVDAESDRLDAIALDPAPSNETVAPAARRK